MEKESNSTLWRKSQGEATDTQNNQVTYFTKKVTRKKIDLENQFQIPETKPIQLYNIMDSYLLSISFSQEKEVFAT